MALNRSYHAGQLSVLLLVRERSIYFSVGVLIDCGGTDWREQRHQDRQLVDIRISSFVYRYRYSTFCCVCCVHTPLTQSYRTSKVRYCKYGRVHQILFIWTRFEHAGSALSAYISFWAFWNWSGSSSKYRLGKL